MTIHLKCKSFSWHMTLHPKCESFHVFHWWMNLHPKHKSFEVSTHYSSPKMSIIWSITADLNTLTVWRKCSICYISKWYSVMNLVEFNPHNMMVEVIFNQGSILDFPKGQPILSIIVTSQSACKMVMLWCHQPNSLQIKKYTEIQEWHFKWLIL